MTIADMTVEQLRAHVATLETQLAAKSTGVTFSTFENKGKIGMSIDIPKFRGVGGSREKILALVEVCKSGAVEEYLTKHPEVK